MKRVLKILGLGLAVLILGLITYIGVAWDKTYFAPYPNITATADSAMIAHGKHLIYGAAHCSGCHGGWDDLAEGDSVEFIPLSGGYVLNTPMGGIPAPNLTPHPEYGIGRLTDPEIARVMRHAVGDDGRVIFPFMPFQDMSDEDISAIISYLRSQEPVEKEVEPADYNAMGKALLAFGMIKPNGPTENPPVTIQKDSTIEYGKYLANSVANCAGCHTKRDMRTLGYAGPLFSGGMSMGDSSEEGHYFVSPNLTPDPDTGIMTNWSEEAFINRFRAGGMYESSPMPWTSFSRMDDVELKAIYRYLQSLEPATNPIPKTAYLPGEVKPES